MDSKQLSSLLELQRKLLESMAAGCSTDQILDDLCRMIEATVPDTLASVMLLERESGSLNVISGPSFPAEALAYFNGMVPSPNMGLCGNAALLGEPVYVTDIATDPRWNGLREAVGNLGIGAFWSIPFFSEKQEILGTFAITSTGAVCPDPQ